MPRFESPIEYIPSLASASAADTILLRDADSPNTVLGLTIGSTLTVSGGALVTNLATLSASTGISMSDYDGTVVRSIALATAGPGAATYGSTDDGIKIDQITLDAYGRVTGITTGNTGTSNLTLANGSDNRIVTATSGTGLNGEANFTWDGSELNLSRTGTSASVVLMKNTDLTGTLATGTGLQENYTFGNASGTNHFVGGQQWSWQDATAATEDGQYRMLLSQNSTNTFVLSVYGADGSVHFDEYGSGNITDASPVYLLGVTASGKIIEEPLSEYTGTIGGSTGSIDNSVLRADGVGGSTAQGSEMYVNDSADVTLGSSSLAGTNRKILTSGSAAVVDLALESKGTTGRIRFYNNNTEHINIANYTMMFKDGAGSVATETGYISATNVSGRLHIRNGGANDYLYLEGNTTDVAIGVLGSATNLDLQLFPKGTGHVAVRAGYETGITADHLVTKQWVDDQGFGTGNGTIGGTVASGDYIVYSNGLDTVQTNSNFQIDDTGVKRIIVNGDTDGERAIINVTNNSSPSTGNHAMLEAISNTGDPYARFIIASTRTWSLGVDNSDSDAFKLTHAASATPDGDLNDPTFMKITTGGIASLSSSHTSGISADHDIVTKKWVDDQGFGTGSGTIGGSTGATDNAVLRADGVGGSTVQSSGVTISDTNEVTAAKFITSGGSSAQFVKGDGTLDPATYSTQTLTLSSENLIPAVNAGGTDFDYSSNFSYNSATDTLFVGVNLEVGLAGTKLTSGDLTLDAGTTGNPRLDFAQNSVNKAWIQYADSGDNLNFSNSGGGGYNFSVGATTSLSISSGNIVSLSSTHTSGISAADDIITKGYADSNYGGGGITDIVQDTTPQLGGNLDLNNFYILGTNHGKLAGGLASPGTGTWDDYGMGTHLFVNTTNSFKPTGATYGFTFYTGKRDSGGAGYGALWHNYDNNGLWVAANTTGADPTWEVVLKLNQTGSAANRIPYMVSGYEATTSSNFTYDGTHLSISTSNDHALKLLSPDTWTGIFFDDSNGAGDYIWFHGQHSTFAIGGGGANISGKKLHVDGGMTIGSSSDSVAMPSNGLYVEGDIQLNTNADIQFGAGTAESYIYSTGTNTVWNLTSGYIQVNTSGTDVFFNTTGLGIGAAAGGGYQLDVTGGVRVSDTVIGLKTIFGAYGSEISTVYDGELTATTFTPVVNGSSTEAQNVTKGLVIGGEGNRSSTTGVGLSFVLSSSTTVSTPSWEMARIVGMHGNSTTGRASGKLLLQTRSNTATLWHYNKGITMDEAGNVGINTHTPAYMLDIETPDTGDGLRITSTAASGTTTGAFLRLVEDDGAALLSSHLLGTIEFAGSYDASNVDVGASIVATASATWSSTVQGTTLSFKVTDEAASSLSTRFILRYDYADFQDELYLYDQLRVRSSNDPMVYLNIIDGGTSWYMAVDDSDSDQLSFGTGATVGSSRKVQFHTSGDVTFGTTGVASTSELWFDYTAADSTLHCEGDIIGNSSSVSSDRRLKNSIDYLTPIASLDVVMSLKPATFKKNNKGDQLYSGFIAQDVEEILPHLIKEKILIGEDEETMYKTLNESGIIAYLVGAIQELNEEIKQLKNG